MDDENVSVNLVIRDLLSFIESCLDHLRQLDSEFRFVWIKSPVLNQMLALGKSSWSIFVTSYTKCAIFEVQIIYFILDLWNPERYAESGNRLTSVWYKLIIRVRFTLSTTVPSVHYKWCKIIYFPFLTDSTKTGIQTDALSFTSDWPIYNEHQFDWLTVLSTVSINLNPLLNDPSTTISTLAWSVIEI